MSGCHAPLTMGNLAYSPQYGGQCVCPCHYSSGIYQVCYCKCRSYHQVAGGQPSVIHLETKVMEERIKKIEEQLKDLNESYQGLSAELRHIMDNLNKKPHKCPLCMAKEHSKLKVKDTENHIFEIIIECHACNGKGIVWG